MVGQFYYEQTPPESFVALAKPEYFVYEKSAFSTGARVLLSIHRSLKFRRASNFSEIGGQTVKEGKRGTLGVPNTATP